uniref:Pancreatic trypsin inhibitor n=1 Tax=Rhipicephalus appendiculatus TaxID=34631 RepID=A0A131YVT8_RHIAP
MMVHSWALLILLFVTLCLGYATKERSDNVTQFKMDCYRNGTCWYPDSCKICPKPQHSFYERSLVYYYDVETKNCQYVIGRITPTETCNSFDNITDCEFFCAVYSDEEYD